MKNFKIIILALIAFLFIGCGIKEVPTDFNAEYTNPILKNNLKQTDKLSINISPNNEFYLLQAEQKFIGAGLRLKVEEKIRVVKYLQDKGTFKVKGAIALVADKLDVSEPTIYRYLKKA